ncbi:hypothetical protein MY4824_008149 [Beauveria thailandica]
MTQTKIKFTAKLNSPHDWDAWDRDFRNQAQKAQVWDLVDPDGTATLSSPEIDYTPAGGPPVAAETNVSVPPAATAETPVDPNIINERLGPPKTRAPDEAEASSSITVAAGKLPMRSDPPAPGPSSRPQTTPKATPRYAEMQFILDEHNRLMALYSTRLAILFTFRIAFAESLHKDYMYAVQEGGDVRDWYRELAESVKPPEKSLYKDYMYAVQEGGDVRGWYRELDKSVKPPEQETWKKQIYHMQALLTPQKFKNTMVDEWAQDVRLSLRKCKRSGIQRYAIEEQTMAEVVDVIKTSFPVDAKII